MNPATFPMRAVRSLALALILTGLTLLSIARAQPIPAKVAHAPATATIIPLSGNWRMDGDIPVHALLISLQGLANRGHPCLYLEYPQDSRVFSRNATA